MCRTVGLWGQGRVPAPQEEWTRWTSSSYPEPLGALEERDGVNIAQAS